MGQATKAIGRAFLTHSRVGQNAFDGGKAQAAFPAMRALIRRSLNRSRAVRLTKSRPLIRTGLGKAIAGSPIHLLVVRGLRRNSRPTSGDPDKRFAGTHVDRYRLWCAADRLLRVVTSSLSRHRGDLGAKPPLR
jgi:hypothetical protein